MTSLKEVNFGINKYCGPAVLSALTGRSTDECANVISRISGKTVIKAVEIGHLIKAFNKLRFDCIKFHFYGYSLFGVLNSLAQQEGCYLVLIPHHVIAVEVKENKIYLIDNHTKSPIDASSSARLSQRVTDVYKITAKEQPVFVKSEIKLTNYCNSVTIKCNNIYKNEEDNTTINLGYINYSNIEQLEQIINELTKIGETK